MSETDPQVYLVEAHNRRVEAGNLIAQAEDFEQRARDAGLEVASDEGDDTSTDHSDEDKKSRFSRK